MSTSYEFADSTPVTSGNSKKHRRGRGIGNRKNKSGTSTTSSSSSSKRSNFRLGGRRGVASLSAQSSSNDKKLSLPGRQQQQQNVEEGSSSRSGGASNRDDNSVGAGSLTYSASSSVQSAESSNDSSFADIIKLIDSEGEGASEIKDFIAKQSKAASGSDAGGNMNVFGQDLQKTSAVAGWIQRVEDRQRQHELEQQRQQQQKKKKDSSSSSSTALNFHMDDSKMPTNINADLTDLNYSKDSKDDSSEDDVYGVDFDDENVLETIAGLDEDISRQAQAAFPDQDPFTNHHQTLSAPSSPGRSQSSGHVTPPPNSRHKRTSTPPGATNISRTNSRHSKSSSDGSWDTPAPSSPPNNNNSPNSKPPHARSAPVSKTRRGKNGKDEKVVEDLSEAFYAKSWMCGFADAFHFDGFDKFNK